MSEINQVALYTDGACSGNPGPGGYGIILSHGSKRREMSAGFRLTTNNRMELRAAIVGLQTLRYKCHVTLYTDSQYVTQGIVQGWAKKWRANGWRRSKKDKAVNVDLWSQLLDLCDQHEVEFAWIKGHAGHSENECCDRLAVMAAQSPDLLVDTGYESAALLEPGRL